MLHDALARIAPEFAISEPEARAIAGKFVNAARHYAVFAASDPKTRDVRVFLTALAVMEGPRVYRVVSRRGAAKKAAHAHAQAAQATNPMGPSGIIVDLDGARR